MLFLDIQQVCYLVERPKVRDRAKFQVHPREIDDEEEMELDDRDDDAQSSDSSRTNTLTDSLRALPNRISRMEEQWRDMLREVKGFMTHSDARMSET